MLYATVVRVAALHAVGATSNGCGDEASTVAEEAEPVRPYFSAMAMASSTRKIRQANHVLRISDGGCDFEGWHSPHLSNLMSANMRASKQKIKPGGNTKNAFGIVNSGPNAKLTV